MNKHLFKLLLLISILVVLLTCFLSCACEHTWVEATCTSPSYCSKCGEKQGEALGHEVGTPATCTESAVCKNCNEKFGSPLGHTVTCASNEPCSRCGKTIDHYYKGNVKTGIIYCTKCNQSLPIKGIEKKSLSELTLEEKAYIQWVIDYYMTAVDSNGRYIYTTDQAYSNAAKSLGFSVSFIKDFWTGYKGTTAFSTIYGKNR